MIDALYLDILRIVSYVYMYVCMYVRLALFRGMRSLLLNIGIRLISLLITLNIKASAPASLVE